MRDTTQRAMAAGLLASLLWLGCLGIASAQEAPLDYPIVNGHFFRQTTRDVPNGQGFRITDDDGVPFWTAFQRLGGVAALGYPISRRFHMDGFVCQATQRAILQWRHDEERVELVNVMEYLSDLGADEILAKDRHVPRPAGAVLDQTRQEWLAASPKIRTVYSGAVDPLAIFGLPLSPPIEMGPAIAMRFQRGVIYEWKEAHPWTDPEQVSVANAGDFVKEMRGLPASAIEPESPPPVREIAAPRRGGPRADARISGVATWYGAYFQGSPMANGEPFDMWDPTLAASNSHPLGTRLKVTRVATGESIVVRVTDRGGFRMPIVVDLSYAGFRRLANPDDGVIRVVVEPAD